jgi:peptide/nickel transport system ATP-binding protein
LHPILSVRNLKVSFAKRSFLSKPALIKAVDGIDFDVNEGEIFCLAGESGCGKSTTARAILGLIPQASGKVECEGVNVLALKKRELRKVRTKMQMIFQDPYSSLNSRMTVFDLVSEPLIVNHLVEDGIDLRERVFNVLKAVELRPPEDFIARYPHQLSGGQRQRVVIAGALVLEPKLLIADEPVSMLDISIRSGILNLLRDLQKKSKIACLFITHDLSAARYLSDYLAVMYLGKIVEIGPTRALIDNPLSPYTEALLAATPTPEPGTRRRRILIEGDVPSPDCIPCGCRLHPRCPKAIEICRKEEPSLMEIEKKRYVACHCHSS